MKMVITLVPDGIYFQILYYVFKHCPATGMKKCDEASPSIIFAGRALLVKMLITLDPDGIFKFCIRK